MEADDAIGKTISATGSDISLAGDELSIRGTLKRIEIPRADVRAITMQEAGSRFRDGFLAGLYAGPPSSSPPARCRGVCRHDG